MICWRMPPTMTPPLTDESGNSIMKKQSRYATSNLAAAFVALVLASEPRVLVAGKPPTLLRDVDADLALFAQAAGVPQECAVEVLVYLRTLIHNWIQVGSVQRTLFDGLEEQNGGSALFHIANWIDDIPAVYFDLDDSVVDGSNRVIAEPALPSCLVSAAERGVSEEAAAPVLVAERLGAGHSTRTVAAQCLLPSKKARHRISVRERHDVLRAPRRDSRTANRGGNQGLRVVLVTQERSAPKAAKSRKTMATAN
jgi:hypothetical protein